MPKGGRRAGAGRKPSVVIGMDGKRQRIRLAAPLPPALSQEERQDVLKPPESLTRGARAMWARWAALAVAERTLTPATAAGFAEMAQRAAYVTELAAKIDHLGAATKEAIPYLAAFDKMSQKLETSLARFKLTAFGKPATSEKPKVTENPWSQVAGK